MESFFRFWRSFPRFFLGFLFVVLVFSIPFGPLILRAFHKIVDSANPADFQGLSTSIVLLFSLGMIGSIGLIALELLVSAGQFVITAFYGQIVLRFFANSGILNGLCAPINILALHYFRKNQDTVLRHVELKSSAMPEALGKNKVVSAHVRRISDFLSNLDSPQFIEYADFQGSLTQDQVLRERLRQEINEIYFILLDLVLIMIVLVLHFLSEIRVSFGIVAFLVLLIVVGPSIIERRRRLAVLILLGYLDNFVIANTATYQDRDAF